MSSWIVQIEPQFDADWNSVSDDTELIALYAEKAKAAGYENNIKKLLDSDAKLYGADCGYSDPNADPSSHRLMAQPRSRAELPTMYEEEQLGLCMSRRY
ncbi:uncharacterized protein IUM83_10705 [Phytophthora cinnamomi]|uniref:uncharacterized protein n=1 Tax=Phytophthora cinnamomi TaxID=4785 RepID=UPI00355A241F|nr:hypothetical protein IUM83_10705 [Phytophthora cinnamomi]